MSLPEHEKNRIAWNEMTDVHFNHPNYKVKEFLEGANSLKSIELEEVGDVKGKHLLHLQCQFGLDTLSWARNGAVVTGVDISDRSIECANSIKEKSGLQATFVRSDVLDLAGKIDHKFDIVFQSHGTHCWISDLGKWAKIVSDHLKPGGFFYIVDFHPIAPVFEEENFSYFNKGPYRYRNEPDYCDKDYMIQSETVEWQHTLADIINPLIAVGLQIEFVHEFIECAYAKTKDWYKKDGWYYPPGGPPNYPQMFSLRARRPE